MSVAGLIIAILFFIVGFIGTVMPFLPGAPLIWLGMLVYGFFVDFHNMSLFFFIGQGLAVALVFLIDYLAGAWGAQKYGGSKTAAWGSIIGGIFGIFLLGPFGLIFGPFIGAVAGEFYLNHNISKAFRIGIGTMVGFLGGTVLKLAIEILMIVWFFIAVC